MATLYVADLDGTLLDREGMLSEYTIQTIRRMTGQGVLFTIATARSPQAANDMIWLLGIRLPSILTNGSLLFDSVGQRYLRAGTIGLDTLASLLQVLDRLGVCGFVFSLKDGDVNVYFRQLYSEWDRVYHHHRVQHFHGHIYQVEDVNRVARYDAPIYVVACGEFDVLSRAQQALEHLHGISVQIYCNVYDSFYYMDIYPSNHTKADAILELQQMTGADELVTFGDNFTDMQMLLVADRAYTPRNAIAAARNISDEVLDYAHRDSVAHFLARDLGWE